MLAALLSALLAALCAALLLSSWMRGVLLNCCFVCCLLSTSGAEDSMFFVGLEFFLSFRGATKRSFSVDTCLVGLFQFLLGL